MNLVNKYLCLNITHEKKIIDYKFVIPSIVKVRNLNLIDKCLVNNCKKNV